MTWWTYGARLTKAGYPQIETFKLDSPHGLPDGVPVFESKQEARRGYAHFKKTSTPRTEKRWAFVTVLDQTIGYLTADGGVTIKHPEAWLFTDEEEALAKLVELNLLDPGRWCIEQVNWDEEFRRREDTW